MPRTLPLLALLVALPAAVAAAPPEPAPAPPAPPPVRWVVQAATGTAWQARSGLRLEQRGEPDLDFGARYETRPFTSGAPYYSLRLGRWRGRAGWELETHHHLLTLANRPPEVESFSATHGYNLNTVNRAWGAAGFLWRLGAGVVVTHPESVVRGRGFGGGDAPGAIHLSGGFFLSGVCGQAAVEKRVPLGRGFALTAEVKGTAAWAKVPIADGWATVPNYAAHALVGVAYEF